MISFTVGCLVILLSSIPLSITEICHTSTCVYNFEVRWSRTMMYRSPTTSRNYHVHEDNHTLVVTKEVMGRQDTHVIGQIVDADDVITADGNPRDIITINGEFPGPIIEAMEGAEVGCLLHCTYPLLFITVIAVNTIMGVRYYSVCLIFFHNSKLLF